MRSVNIFVVCAVAFLLSAFRPQPDKKPSLQEAIGKMWPKEYNEEFKPEEYVYKLVDLDRNGSPELLIMKEKVRQYNWYGVYSYVDGVVELICERISGGLAYYAYYSDGFVRYYEEHSGGLSFEEVYYKLEEGKVVAYVKHTVSRDAWDDDELEESRTLTILDKSTPRSEKIEDYYPKGKAYSLYDIKDWESF
ncbi:hypothetical protein [Porphyromonas endodontalis]|uniref:hypothetical protein n=1 Tax=Porphyromonas endodontalis TaxID=28124 RepID=UPI0028E7F507|nr:hypothetical protein [Porphyromonas endodontalis]